MTVTQDPLLKTYQTTYFYTLPPTVEESQTLLPFKQCEFDFGKQFSHSLPDHPFFKNGSRRIDFVCWIKELMKDIAAMHAYLTLEPYQLHTLYELTSFELAEVRSLSYEAKEAWISETLERLLGETYTVMEQVQAISDYALRPWVAHRGGIAAFYEIQERLLRLSGDEDTSERCLQFMSELFFDGKPIFTDLLPEVAQNLYAVDRTAALRFEQVQNKALSYFVNSQSLYTFRQLVSFVEREFARDWTDFHEGFVEKVCRRSNLFRVRKNRDHHLVIGLR